MSIRRYIRTRTVEAVFFMALSSFAALVCLTAVITPDPPVAVQEAAASK